MCLRVLNNLNSDYPVTGRNMNWFRPIEANLFQFPQGLSRQGVSEKTAVKKDLAPSVIFHWKSKYASAVSMMGNDIQGYATTDGMNSEGLVVNVLYDTPATYGKPKHYLENGNISILRWPQYILDSFANVIQVVNYAKSNTLQLIKEKIPEGGKAKDLQWDKIHLAVSDSQGHSAVIEIKNGELHVYAGDENQIVTNEPAYPTQLDILKYWQYLWGQTTPAIATPVLTAPGGISATQSFERAAFYLSLSDKVQSPAEVLAQTRALMQNGAIPFAFNPSRAEQSTCTRWTNLGDHKAGLYYFLNPLNMIPVWLKLNADASHSARVKLITVNNVSGELNNHPELEGEVNHHLIDCEDPFKA
ncbi:linear amide C-N hydrolase [Shewanella marinintestina]|uniref:linear amide C-N hydrolase n=1 Tax=Shewanella marinintestina TaxID=190305 RepID=UPI0024B09DEC|nr:linear amide C-N hydrolase [Shewanella marinintestina]